MSGTGVGSIGGSIASGPITQIAWVSDDIDATQTLLSDQFGVTQWMRIPDVHFGPDTCTFRGEPADFTAHIALAHSGDMQLELIQPVSGESIYTEFLRTTPAGLHHVCFDVDDLDLACRNAEAAGVPVIQRGTMADGAMSFAYLDGAAAGAPYIELAQISPEMRGFFDSLRG